MTELFNIDIREKEINLFFNNFNRMISLNERFGGPEKDRLLI